MISLTLLKLLLVNLFLKISHLTFNNFHLFILALKIKWNIKKLSSTFAVKNNFYRGSKVLILPSCKIKFLKIDLEL